MDQSGAHNEKNSRFAALFDGAWQLLEGLVPIEQAYGTKRLTRLWGSGGRTQERQQWRGFVTSVSSEH